MVSQEPLPQLAALVFAHASSNGTAVKIID